MNLFLLLVFILSCYGLSNMVVFSNGPWHIFVKLRKLTDKINPKLGELFSCMMCFPFWVGFMLSFADLFLIKNASLTPFNILLQGDNAFIAIFTLFMDGAVSSGSTWILHNIEEYFETNKS